MIVTFLAALCLMLLGTGLSARAQPSISETDARERAGRFASHVVRVLPRWATPQEGTRPVGFGIIVGRQGQDLYIATPHHVVWDAGRLLSNRPLVRFRPMPGADVVEMVAERQERFAIPPMFEDLAVLIVRGGAARAPAAAAPAIAPQTMRGGDRFWVFGRSDGWALSGTSGGFIDARDPPSRLAFDNLQVAPGFSGAAVVRAEGIVGMVLAQHARGLETFALPATDIIRRFRGWGLPVDLLTEQAPSRPHVVGLAGATTPAPTPQPVPRAGEVFRDCAECPEMVVVPAGRFTMGSPEGEAGRDADEGPQREVLITSYAVGKFEVTRGQFAAFVRATEHDAGNACQVWTGTAWEPREGVSWRNPGYVQDDTHPVVCISWENARAYVAWLSRVTGKAYRLLSEAEWEDAARAGTQAAFPTGAMIRPDQAQFTWTISFAGSPTRLSADGRTAPVGRFAANGFGLHDMHGNVWEWVQDCYRDSYTGAPLDGRAVEGGACGTRVQRGGSWNNAPRFLRSANRGWSAPVSRNNGVGFRVARTL